MSYRIMHVAGGYPDFLARLTAGIPDGERTYDRLLDAYVAGWHDYWVRGFRACGHAAEMVVCNFEALQKAWAAEHRVQYDEAHWAQQIFLSQAKAWKPDVVWIQDLYFVTVEMRRALRELLPDVVLLGWRFATTRDMTQFRDLDVMITGADAFADEFRKNGIRTEVVPLFFPETIMSQVQPAQERSHPFVFCGSIGKADGWHSLRYRTIEELLRRTPLEVYGRRPAPGSCNPRWASLLRACPRGLRNSLAARLRHRVPIQSWHPDRFHDAVFGRDYFRLLADTQLCLNVHIDMAVGFAGNQRLFEATGMGACLLTDWKPNLAGFFEPDREVAVYRSPEEAADKANYLLAHPGERQAIAENGRRRTLRDHTLTSRMAAMDEIIVQSVQRRASTRPTVPAACPSSVSSTVKG